MTGAGKRRGRDRPAADLEPSPERSAVLGRLRYVSDDEPGYRRRRCGRGFTFIDPDGETVLRSSEERERLVSLAVPPAWTDVWICVDPHGHLLATGRDVRGRKQYLYHPRWREVRNETKFHRMREFGRALPALRARRRLDLGKKGLRREKVLAAIVYLLDATAVRIGNEEYRRANDSYGLTTLRDRHVVVEGRKVRLRFIGKGGEEVEATVRDARVARVLRECREVPGRELFQYREGGGERRTVRSVEVNEYLKEASGRDFSAKDFRTWRASVDALARLAIRGPHAADEADAVCLEVVDAVAETLGNSREVCRDFYIHPVLLEAYRDGSLFGSLGDSFPPEPTEGLSGEETALLRVLESLEGARSPG